MYLSSLGPVTHQAAVLVHCHIMAISSSRLLNVTFPPKWASRFNATDGGAGNFNTLFSIGESISVIKLGPHPVCLALIGQSNCGTRNFNTLFSIDNLHNVLEIFDTALLLLQHPEQCHHLQKDDFVSDTMSTRSGFCVS